LGITLIPGEKLLIKLWESIVDKGIGAVLKPWQIRREGRATVDVRRDELLMIAQAEIDVADIRAGRKTVKSNGKLLALSSPEQELLCDASNEPLQLSHVEVVAEQNYRAEAIRREISISKAVLHAEKELAEDPQEPPDNSISDDWLFRWRDCAASVSSENLLSLWGKVLAGEVKSPGGFSLRALEFLKNLSQDEAKAIEKISPFVIDKVIYMGKMELLESEGVKFSDVFSLQELGIVSGVDTSLTMIWPSTQSDRFLIPLTSHGKALIVKHSDASQVIRLEKVCQVTSMGRQIFKLGSFQPNEAYLRAIGTIIKEQGFDVELSQCIDKGNSTVSVFNPQSL